MLKRALGVAIVATAISVPAIAGAAGGKKHHKAGHKVTSHNVTETVTVANISPPGAIVPGRQTYAGIVDAVIGSQHLTGAARGVNNVTVTSTTAPVTASFQGTITTFGPDGSITATVSGTAKVNADGSESFTGTALPQTGTGIYKTLKGGTLTFSGTAPGSDADDGPNPTAATRDADAVVASFTATGQIKY